jgi:tetratricopeptide (TPR) repeat protein
VQYAEYDAAIGFAEHGLALASAAGDAWQTAYAKATLALTLDAAGRSGRTPMLLAEARGAFASIDEPRGDWGVAHCEFVTGLTAVRAADLEAVERASTELRHRARRIQYDLFEGWSHLMDGWVAERRGDPERAEREYQRIVELTQGLGVGGHMAFGVVLLGRLAARGGQLERARWLQTEAATLVADGAAPWFAAFAHSALALTLWRLGDAGAAEALLRQAIAECPSGGSRFSQERFFSLFGGSPAGRAQVALGALVRARGADAEAEELQVAGLTSAERDGDTECIALGFEAMAAADARTGGAQRAATLLGAAAGIRDMTHAPRDLFEETSVAETTALLLRELGADELARCMSAGAALPVYQALAVARPGSTPVVQ